MKISRIYVGGWFQRTTLHLSEIYDFFRDGYSPLELEKGKLLKLRNDLDLTRIEFGVKGLEHIEAESREGVAVRVYEDGLILLGKHPGTSVREDIGTLTSYYEKRLSPGLGYIFSLGAPVPKELANIKTIYPYFVVLDKAKKKDVDALLADFDQEEYFEVIEKSFEVYRGDKLYIINNIGEKIETIERFVEEQIFFREFKGQLHRYLNLHRIIWEKIADVKEQGKIKGTDIGGFKGKIEQYAKTINLIHSRINQMGSYIGTRETVAHGDKDLGHFMAVMRFKYETLSDTLAYIKEIWAMTERYVDSALALFSDLQARSTETSIQNLTIVTSMGVGAALISLFTESAPDFTWFGVLYFFILAFVGISANRIMKAVNLKKMYEIDDTEIDTDIR